jgi:hypothetical protein
VEHWLLREHCFYSSVSVPGITLTDFLKLRTIHNNSNNGNIRNIDFRLYCFKIRSAWTKVW